MHAWPRRPRTSGCVPRWPGVAVCVLRWPRVAVYAAFRNPTRLQKDPGSSFHDSPHFRGFRIRPGRGAAGPSPGAVRSPGPGGSGRKLRRTWRRGLSTLRSTRTRDCHVPRATWPPSTGRVTEGQTSAGRRWSAPCPGDPWAVPVPPVVRQEPLQRGQQVGLGPRARLHEGQAGRGVRRQRVHQAVPASGAEPLQVPRQVDDPLPGRVDVDLDGVHRLPSLPGRSDRFSSPAVTPACQVRAKNSTRCRATSSACVRMPMCPAPATSR